jgi:hypothetical protein
MVAKRNDNMLAQLALHVATGKTVAAAGRDLGVDPSTAQSWARLPSFKARVDRIRAKIDDMTIGVLVRASTKAAKRLEKLIASENEQVALSACKTLLEKRHEVEANSAQSKRLAEFQRQLTAIASVVPPQPTITVEARRALEAPAPAAEEDPDCGTPLSDTNG